MAISIEKLQRIVRATRLGIKRHPRTSIGTGIGLGAAGTSYLYREPIMKAMPERGVVMDAIYRRMGLPAYRDEPHKMSKGELAQLEQAFLREAKTRRK